MTNLNVFLLFRSVQKWQIILAKYVITRDSELYSDIIWLVRELGTRRDSDGTTNIMNKDLLGKLHNTYENSSHILPILNSLKIDNILHYDNFRFWVKQRFIILTIMRSLFLHNNEYITSVGSTYIIFLVKNIISILTFMWSTYIINCI